MKILITTHAFPPAIGGIETVGAVLAKAWIDKGLDVSVLSEDSGPDLYESVPVYRNCNLLRRIRSVVDADIVFQNNMTAGMLLLALLLRRPVVIYHQTYLTHRKALANIKRLLMSFAKNVAISKAVEADARVSCEIIHPPIDSLHLDNQKAQEERGNSILFVGRLVSDKGVEHLLRAFSKVVETKAAARLTIVGDGPERERLAEVTQSLGLQEKVHFLGRKSGTELRSIYRMHLIAVVPSVWPEPYGLVAVEAAANGCIVLGSSGGGLPEAVGPSGAVYTSGNVTQLSLALLAALRGQIRPTSEAVERHVQAHSGEDVARRIGRVLENALAEERHDLHLLEV